MPGVFIAGSGAGLTTAPLAQLTLQDVPVQHVGGGSGPVSTVIQLAASLGVALYLHPQPDRLHQPPHSAGLAFATMWVSRPAGRHLRPQLPGSAQGRHSGGMAGRQAGGRRRPRDATDHGAAASWV